MFVDADAHLGDKDDMSEFEGLAMLDDEIKTGFGEVFKLLGGVEQASLIIKGRPFDFLRHYGKLGGSAATEGPYLGSKRHIFVS